MRIARGGVAVLLGLVSVALPGCNCSGDDLSDAGAVDSGARPPDDAGAPDSGADAGPPDAGPVDAGPPDAGPTDAGAVDADAGLLDAGPADAGAPDAGRLDAGAADAGAGVDSGVPDAGMLSCCMRLGFTLTATWLASDGGLPNLSCPPWALTDSAAPEDPAFAGGALVVDTSADTENMYYLHQGAEVFTGAAVVLEARLRLVSGSASVSSRGPVNIIGVFGPLKRKAALQIEVGGIFLNSDENVRGASATLDTTTAPRDYRIEVDQATGAIQVFVDGVSTLTGQTFPAPTGTNVQVLWGEGSLFAHGRSEWFFFRHSAYGGCL
jgi:hypothetical protein